MAGDIQAEALGWALDEIDRQAFGEHYGAAVTLAMAVVQVPGGARQIPMWSLLITARNPIVGESQLYHGPVPIGCPRPLEKDVRDAVTEGLRLLRDLAASKLAVGNGKAPAALAKGSG